MIAPTSHQTDSVGRGGRERLEADDSAVGVGVTVGPVNAAVDVEALARWSAEVAGAYKQRGGLQGSLGHRLVHGPGWAARIIVRKGRQIGWTATIRLVFTTARARLRAAR